MKSIIPWVGGNVKYNYYLWPPYLEGRAFILTLNPQPKQVTVPNQHNESEHFSSEAL